ncbi:hypothetical protein DM02DRAFT_440273 [Periconia macrospinosa]|uniref:Chromo domain-containing protein n=1 Tax=Periconia macrospinosa TaxID=97972 RepID=A0A2V1CXL9_9PLEO|nr:hypothetical protein DM02DRAFT_440273 [Periconia macrospinosa]
MASGSKNARTQRNLAPKERHRRMPFTHKKSHRANKYWDAVRILQDNGTRYLVEWYPDPVTGTRYPPTWEPHNYVTPALESEWKEMRTLPSPAKTYPLRRTQVHDLEASGSIPNDSAMSDSPCATDQVAYARCNIVHLYFLQVPLSRPALSRARFSKVRRQSA